MSQINLSSEKEIVSLFEEHYVTLCKTVNRIVQDTYISEDIVQDIFFNLWNRKQKIAIKTSLTAYLKKIAINAAIDHLRKNNKLKAVKSEDISDMVEIQDTAQADTEVNISDLSKMINQAINKLPDRCRIIFLLSRHEQMSYKEISVQLDISVKTVENQMTKALRFLKEKLNNYL